MLATLVAEPFSNPKWLFEPKLDGFRILAFIRKGEVTLRTRFDSSVGPGLSFAGEGAVSVRWWLYVASFFLGAALIVIGLSRANTPLTFAGVIIGAVLFLTRKYIQ